jgi:sugar O-acyltransferase (sialic acid O-acetyltransferase NeuD family)
MSTLVLIGGGGHSRDVFGLIQQINELSDSEVEVSRILDDYWDNKARFANCLVDLVIGIESNLTCGDQFIVAVGYPKMRKELVKKADYAGAIPHTALVHPQSVVAGNCEFASGVLVFGGSVISPNVVLGTHSCISAGVFLGHDTILSENVSIMPGAIVSGDVKIGPDVMVGAGATVLEKVTIGEGAVVGAGALVIKDVEPHTTVVGIPAKLKQN